MEFTELHDWDVSPVEARAMQAAALYYRYLPLLVSERQPKLGLALRKEALRRRGLFAHPSVREPGPKVDTKSLAALSQSLADVDIDAALARGDLAGSA
jgi:4-hydroxy-tetrahydrodipicolinate synthase